MYVTGRAGSAARIPADLRLVRPLSDGALGWIGDNFTQKIFLILHTHNVRFYPPIYCALIFIRRMYNQVFYPPIAVPVLDFYPLVFIRRLFFAGFLRLIK